MSIQILLIQALTDGIVVRQQQQVHSARTNVCHFVGDIIPILGSHLPPLFTHGAVCANLCNSRRCCSRQDLLSYTIQGGQSSEK